MSNFLDDNKRSLLDFYSDIRMAENMLREINEGLTGDSRADEGYRNMHNGTFDQMIDDKITLFDSLGENARRLLEIGIVQDVLVKLGFKPFQEEEREAEIMYFRLPIGNDESIEVNFKGTVEVGIGMFWCSDLTSKSEYAYTSPNWQDDLINKVKGLIECNY